MSDPLSDFQRWSAGAQQTLNQVVWRGVQVVASDPQADVAVAAGVVTIAAAGWTGVGAIGGGTVAAGGLAKLASDWGSVPTSPAPWGPSSTSSSGAAGGAPAGRAAHSHWANAFGRRRRAGS